MLPDTFWFAAGHRCCWKRIEHHIFFKGTLHIIMDYQIYPPKIYNLISLFHVSKFMEPQNAGENQSEDVLSQVNAQLNVYPPVELNLCLSQTQSFNDLEF
jgi:hypothetical protein